jgi:hypothetical protein
MSEPLPPRGLLLAHARAMLETLGARLVKVTIEGDDGTRLELAEVPGQDHPEVPAHVLPRRIYSPLESEIVTALAGQGWVRVVDLAELLKRDPASSFRTVVTNLADAGVLESGRLGVRLARGDD